MISINLIKLTSITNGILYCSNYATLHSISIHSITTDTRKITPKCLFIALIGKNFDAHMFVNEAISKGAAALLLEKQCYPKNVIPQIIVQNTTIALGKIASWIRDQTNATVIAITGSSGKTSVKEMTSSILKNCGNTISTFQNLNNNIGVPLTLLNLNKSHKYAILELGANYPKDIEYTTKITKPNIALINNIYHSHLAGFKSLFGVAQAKQEIFLGLRKNGIAIYNKDSNYWSKWKKNLLTQKIINFSIKKNSTIFASNITTSNQGSKFKIHSPNGEIYVTLPLLGYHNISNALAAATIAISINIPLEIIKIGLSSLPILKNRLQIIRLNKYKTIINDTYNANTASMIVAIKILENISGYKLFVAGDMLELGKNDVLYHKIIGNTIYNSNINEVFSIGKLSKEISIASKKGHHFYNSDELLKNLKNKLLNKKIITILVKASRSEKLDVIVEQLIKEYHKA
ncbi:UDP-N-acetylmuramoylalanyl-D-glutamyl-2,6-diaminopimelate-D-alanyl-D- alanyl ligase [Buchnera aphidicola str. Bp (Baizongia pistaciae)]|uniref:UDP-N-acetylmuramoyl-tripeptide--D-alanyl-D-alanine ligase n=1 Tax=Buchnera aphidicola subsp. Baizongia pistaciae (strain Bp) TaxID=224915 RepID=MURF_BUCBP|nr:UDP-N-acetylmuramoyl-tripeptide--D-alanyl-D-alanine ligase [Buchnera aphidicola]Q89AQ1.1 RecName: Full=UDP-N-acetylmuramoyl-tripeptide--D-alanyl-D-alanine ligase; AltName: Full=D-alanyl-D-alanine-adding enzyme; AltName: Full=UDP-MurNAc-pentapeptide synthetase [Buchnera aphidicola str. Bp (Baizongia pistaciae)]AAO26934.1 UDP-N-acetylmuramoylalanyl-D-glutamyl-2,6-diaminopimelate-D-alanyl-D- alanyl ligase [Buchnera aphidicola str. Bp (Baizongia pistaciae)]